MKEKITSNQFYILFFLCSVYYLSTLSSEAVNNNFPDSILAASVSMLLSVLLSLPVLLLHDKKTDYDAITTIKARFGKVAKPLFLLYILYFLVVDIAILTLMQNLLTSTIFPTVPPVFIGTLAVAVGIYGASKKIQTVARAGLLVFIFFILGTLLIFWGVTPLFEFENRKVFLYEGMGDAARNTLAIFVRSTFMPQMVFLLSAVKGKSTKKSPWWHLAVAVMSISMFVFVDQALGKFATTQFFPTYTLSSVSSMGPFQRFDIIFTAVWLMSLVIHLSCDLLCIKDCMKGVLAQRRSATALIVAGIVIVSVSTLVMGTRTVQVVLACTIPLAILAVLLGFCVPLILFFRRANR